MFPGLSWYDSTSDALLPIVLSSRFQLLEIARGLEYLHGLGIVHGNVGIVRLVLVRQLYCALTFPQTNFLVGGDGHVRIAGLGTAFIPPTAPGDMMASDIYGFSFLAWEVRMKIVASLMNH